MEKKLSTYTTERDRIMSKFNREKDKWKQTNDQLQRDNDIFRSTIVRLEKEIQQAHQDARAREEEYLKQRHVLETYVSSLSITGSIFVLDSSVITSFSKRMKRNELWSNDMSNNCVNRTIRYS
jgi:hypothetical protein